MGSAAGCLINGQVIEYTDVRGSTGCVLLVDALRAPAAAGTLVENRSPHLLKSEIDW